MRLLKATLLFVAALAHKQIAENDEVQTTIKPLDEL